MITSLLYYDVTMSFASSKCHCYRLELYDGTKQTYILNSLPIIMYIARKSVSSEQCLMSPEYPVSQQALFAFGACIWYARGSNKGALRWYVPGDAINYARMTHHGTRGDKELREKERRKQMGG